MKKYLYENRQNKLVLEDDLQNAQIRALSEEHIYSLIDYTELERLRKSLADKDEIINRYIKKVKEGEKGYNKAPLEQGTVITGIKFIYSRGGNDFYTLETNVPDNMEPMKVKKYFQNRTVKELYPELPNAEKYRISAAYLKKDACWIVEISR